MTARPIALACAAAGLVLAFAQLLLPGSPVYHGWQYALALAVTIVSGVAYVARGARGRDGARGRRLALAVAVAGAVLAELGALASGLLGPDTSEVVGTPGTVVPIPALGAAAFFARATPRTIAGADGAVTLRRRGAPDVGVASGGRAALGDSVLFLAPRPAAYVEAFDERGAHLTVTQPAAASFLSPVLLFPQRQRIGAVDVPLDTFAAPALHLTVHALYFTPADLATFGHAGLAASSPALVLSAADDRGRPVGLAMAPSGRTVALAGLRVRVTIGSYPALAVAAAPPPALLYGGLLLFALGLGWAALGGGGVPGTVAEQSRTPTTPEATTGGAASVPTT